MQPEVYFVTIIHLPDKNLLYIMTTGVFVTHVGNESIGYLWRSFAKQKSLNYESEIFLQEKFFVGRINQQSKEAQK